RMTSPPRPPSPPSGPPCGMYDSRRKLTAPAPPRPAATSITAWSRNIGSHSLRRLLSGGLSYGERTQLAHHHDNRARTDGCARERYVLADPERTGAGIRIFASISHTAVRAPASRYRHPTSTAASTSAI